MHRWNGALNMDGQSRPSVGSGREGDGGEQWWFEGEGGSN
jgi:hypothetical protein